MKIKTVKLRHCTHFSELNIDFNDSKKPITLILGDQATGKTAIVKNIYHALTWFSARFKDMRTAGVVMSDLDIMQNRVQSKIDIQVSFPADIGQLSESSDNQEKDLTSCRWQLYKTLNTLGQGHSKVETQALEQLINLYIQALQQDPLVGMPMIAYYPTDRFITELNLISKSNPAIFLNHSAYELAAIPYTTFARFFEWFREISDIENAQTAHLFQQLLSAQSSKIAYDPNDATTVDFDLNQKLFQSYSQLHAPSLLAVKTALKQVLPELSDLYLEYLPKLQLMVTYQDQTIPYLQLSSSIKNWIALVGDIVRRLCLLNPNSLYPCIEGDGILLIDSIDAQLDAEMSSIILERLHQAFPQLQIIATGTRNELLESAEDYQCFRLNHKTLQPIDLNSSNDLLEQIHAQMLQHIPSVESESLTEPNDAGINAQNIFEKFQNLSTEQQTEFLQLIQGNDQSFKAKI